MPEDQPSFTMTQREGAALRNRRSLVGLTLDCSDSMWPLANMAVQSVNDLIEQQKAIAGEAGFTLSLFNNRIEMIHDGVAIHDVLRSHQPIQPSGGTALNDAVAALIRSLSSQGSGRHGHVLAVILTDGEENSSRQESTEDVRQQVTYRRLTHRWQFLFIGPQSALSYALRIGIPKANTAPFEAENFELILDRVSKSVSAFRLGDPRFMLKLQDRK